MGFGESTHTGGHQVSPISWDQATWVEASPGPSWARRGSGNGRSPLGSLQLPGKHLPSTGGAPSPASVSPWLPNPAGLCLPLGLAHPIPSAQRAPPQLTSSGLWTDATSSRGPSLTSHFSLPVQNWTVCRLTPLPRRQWEGALGRVSTAPPQLTTSWALLCSSRAWAACCCR